MLLFLQLYEILFFRKLFLLVYTYNLHKYRRVFIYYLIDSLSIKLESQQTDLSENYEHVIFLSWKLTIVLCIFTQQLYNTKYYLRV